jgi:conjugal transfer pilus assembly protein TraF
MIKSVSYAIVLVSVVIVMSSHAIAADDATDNFRDSRRDWYFYKKERINPEAEEKKTEQKPAPSISGISATELWNMHPDQFKELVDVTHKRMVQYPDDDKTMGEWIYLKDIARRKSLAVTSAETAYLQRHPEYNMTKDAPTVSVGRTQLYKQQKETVEARLKQEKDSFGLLFFYSPECGYCEEQSKILTFFINKYQWDVKGVDITREVNARTKFDISTTPTLLLVQRSTGDSMTIAVGIVSLEEMEGTIYRAVRYLKKEITPEQWNVYESQEGGLMDPLGLVNMERGRTE